MIGLYILLAALAVLLLWGMFSKPIKWCPHNMEAHTCFHCTNPQYKGDTE